MKIIATLPPPYLRRMKEVTSSPGIDAFRLNTGVVTPCDAFETLKQILRIVDENKLWIDIKGTQLRIDSWAVPEYSELILNREVKVDLPATIYFRHEKVASTIVEMKGRRIYVDPLPQNFVGAGQAVNIHGSGYEVVGEYLMESDKRYIKAGKELGVNNYMLSFLESQSQVDEVLEINPDAHVCGKIETPKGLETFYSGLDRYMIARDDYFINCGFDAKRMFEAQKIVIGRDPTAMAASRILTSLLNSGEEEVALADLADIYLLRKTGYQNFMLGDELSKSPIVLRKAVEILRYFEK